MALHGALPLEMRVERGVVRLRTDGGGVEQDLGAFEHKRPRRFRVPLIPADADADGAGARWPRLEAGVAGAEVIFLHVARPVGDVALAIDPEDFAARAGDRDAVEIARAVFLEEGDGNDDAKFVSEFSEREHARVLAYGIGGREPFRVLPSREVDALEQLRRQDRLRAFPRGLADQALDLGDIGRHVVAERGLDGGNGEGARAHYAGSSRVMQ